MSMKPSDISQDVWAEANGVVDTLFGMHDYAGRPAWDEPIARAIMTAEKRGEDRARDKLRQMHRRAQKAEGAANAA